MSRTLGCVFLAFVSVVYAARSNVCLATSGAKFYRPLQLYPSDCPNNASNCMAAVYNYSPKEFKSKGPATIMPKAKESLVWMSQDESDNLDVTVITATSYTNNIIKTYFEIDGAAPGTQVLMKDDPETIPPEDHGYWDGQTNRGNVTWKLQPGYTDGVVFGHFKLLDNYCFRVKFLPNWGGAISNIVFLSGTVASPRRVISKPLVGNSTYSTFFEFCQYPSAVIQKTDATCSSKGSATVTPISNGTASIEWTKDGVVIGNTNTITGLDAGEYVATINVEGCTATRPVTIAQTGSKISATYSVTNPTKLLQGKIVLSISGGTPPYTITWRNAMNAIIASGTTMINVSAGSFTATITDGCSTVELEIDVSGPDSCAPGTFVDGDECPSCPAGTYSETVDSATCTVCPPGEWSTATKATSCNKCAANTYSGGATGPCYNCPVSTSSPTGSGLCTSCPVGTERASGEPSCTPCDAGSYRCQENTVCQACPAGTFSTAGKSSCTACDPGTFTSQTGRTSCASCPVDSYSASGASACSSCPAGSSAPAGSSVLLACM